MCHSVFLLLMHHARVIIATEELENCECLHGALRTTPYPAVRHSAFLLPMHQANITSTTEEFINCESLAHGGPRAISPTCTMRALQRAGSPHTTHTLRHECARWHRTSYCQPGCATAQCCNPSTLQAPLHATIAGLGSGSGPNQDEGESKGIGIVCNLYAGNLNGGRYAVRDAVAASMLSLRGTGG